MDSSRRKQADEFIEANYRRLGLLATALSSGHGEANDLLQTSLERLYKAWLKADVDDPWALIKTIMVRANIDTWRRRSREVVVHDFDEPAHPEGHDIGVDLVSSLKYLSANQRTALALKYLEDLETPEIGRLMNCSEGTVRSHLSRGISKLRVMLVGEGANRGDR